MKFNVRYMCYLILCTFIIGCSDDLGENKSTTDQLESFRIFLEHVQLDQNSKELYCSGSKSLLADAGVKSVYYDKFIGELKDLNDTIKGFIDRGENACVLIGKKGMSYSIYIKDKEVDVDITTGNQERGVKGATYHSIYLSQGGPLVHDAGFEAPGNIATRLGFTSNTSGQQQITISSSTGQTAFGSTVRVVIYGNQYLGQDLKYWWYTAEAPKPDARLLVNKNRGQIDIPANGEVYVPIVNNPTVPSDPFWRFQVSGQFLGTGQISFTD